MLPTPFEGKVLNRRQSNDDNSIPFHSLFIYILKATNKGHYSVSMNPKQQQSQRQNKETSKKKLHPLRLNFIITL
jgi:hypothetical protein